MFAGMRYDRKVTDIIQGVKITGGFDTYASLPVANTPGVYHFILSVERLFDISCRNTPIG